MTVQAGVVGSPIAHSLSPLIHATWIAAAGLDARYVAHGPETPEAFEALLDRGRRGALRGLNVTAPYKEQAYAAADQVSDAARLSGSANLLVFEDGRIRADSTDGLGLMNALGEQAPDLRVEGKPVVILGAGGAARAAAGALALAGAQVRILNRSRDRAERLAADLGPAVAVVEDASAFIGAALVVNALSVRPDLDVGRLNAGTVVMDMTYRPLETPLLAAARARGLVGVDGLAMLIGQARPSFQAIFGHPVPETDVRERVLRHLGEAA